MSHARDVLVELRALRDRVGPGELLDRAIRRTGYDGGVLAEFLGERKLANLRKLQAMGHAVAAGAAGPGLRGFAARLRESVKEEFKEDLAATAAEEADVVKLMTIHAAKGLQFPVVFACDLDREPQKTAGAGRGGRGTSAPWCRCRGGSAAS